MKHPISVAIEPSTTQRTGTRCQRARCDLAVKLRSGLPPAVGLAAASGVQPGAGSVLRAAVLRSAKVVLALLWQIYSRRFCLPIQIWQYGHCRGLDRMMR